MVTLISILLPSYIESKFKLVFLIILNSLINLLDRLVLDAKESEDIPYNDISQLFNLVILLDPLIVFILYDSIKLLLIVFSVNNVLILGGNTEVIYKFLIISLLS